MVYGRARAEITTRDNNPARTGETTRYSYGNHVNKETTALHMCPLWSHNSSDGSSQTRASLNDRIGSVGVPRGLNSDGCLIALEP